MDITTDGFGYMLAFGDLAWVPFTYTLQARYLVNHDPAHSTAALAAIAALNLVGYAIFRGNGPPASRTLAPASRCYTRHLFSGACASRRAPWPLPPVSPASSSFSLCLH